MEATLATFQLADAQDRATQAQQAATEQQRLANVADSAEQRHLAREAEKSKATEEEITFWTRRFMTSVSIASAAGFVAVLTFLLKTDSPAIGVKPVRMALTYFGVAAGMGAFVPIIHLLSIYSRRLFSLYEATITQRQDPRPSFTAALLLIYRTLYANPFLNWFYVMTAVMLFVGAVTITVGSAAGYYEARIRYEEDMSAYSAGVPRAAAVAPVEIGNENAAAPSAAPSPRQRPVLP